MNSYNRQIDSLGRVVFPAELLRSIGLQKGDFISLTGRDGKILIETQRPTCRLCGTTEGVKEEIPLWLRLHRCGKTAERIAKVQIYLILEIPLISALILSVPAL